jgi:hypothetical protein
MSESALIMAAVSTSETSVDLYQPTRRYDPEDGHLHAHRRPASCTDVLTTAGQSAGTFKAQMAAARSLSCNAALVYQPRGRTQLRVCENRVLGEYLDLKGMK